MRFATRPLALSLLLLAALPAEEPANGPVAGSATPAAVTPAAPAWTIDPAQHAEIARVLAVAVAHGFPDAAGATIHQGELKYGDPQADGADHHSTTMRFRGGFRTVSDGVTTVGGLHLKLADGRWLVGLSKLVPGAEVDAKGLTEVAPGDLLATARKLGGDRMREASDQDIERGLERFAPEQRALLRSGVQWIQLFAAMELSDPAEGKTLVLHLVRLGVPQAEVALALLGADQEDFRAMAGGDEPAPLLLTAEDRQRHQQLSYQRMRKRMGKLRDDAEPHQTLAPLPVLATRALGDWFRARLEEPTPDLPSERAIAGLEAVLGTTAPPDLQARARMLVARAALPLTLPADASFALRAALWDPPSRSDDMGMDERLSELSDEQLKQMPEEMREQIAKAKAAKANRFTLKDLGALIALTGDTGASRWLDGGDSWMDRGERVPRTVGENALRAIATLLHVDPRVLLGRDPFEPWSPAAQAATAAALKGWWQERAQQPLPQVLSGVIASLDAGAAGRLISATPEAERAPLIAALVAHWRNQPPLTASAAQLVDALLAVGEDPAAAEVVRALPVAGAQRLVLATWHARHGDDVPLDQLLDEALGAGTPAAAPAPAAGGAPAADSAPAPVIVDADAEEDEGGAGGQTGAVLAVVARLPTVPRVTRLLTALGGGLDQPATSQVVALGFSFGGTRSPALKLVSGPRSHRSGDGDDTAVRSLLQLALLSDVRPLPAGAATMQGGNIILKLGGDPIFVMSGMGVMGDSEPDDAKAKPPTLPADLRICDLAARDRAGNSWKWGMHDDGNAQPFDLAQPPAARDAALGELRTRSREAATKALTAAKLPLTLLPKAPQAAGGTDEKALF